VAKHGCFSQVFAGRLRSAYSVPAPPAAH
jgi:hypothetical protein